MTITSMEDCETACDQDLECKAFDYKPSDSTCCLYGHGFMGDGLAAGNAPEDDVFCYVRDPLTTLPITDGGFSWVLADDFVTCEETCENTCLEDVMKEVSDFEGISSAAYKGYEAKIKIYFSDAGAACDEVHVGLPGEGFPAYRVARVGEQMTGCIVRPKNDSSNPCTKRHTANYRGLCACSN